MDADGPDSDETGVDEEGDKRMEDRANEHDAFAEEEEDGENGDYDVEVCGTEFATVSTGRSNEGLRENSQLTPWQRGADGLIIGSSIYDLVWITVPSSIGALLPESGAIKIRLSDAEEGEASDGKRQFGDEKADEGFGSAPLFWDC